MFNKGDKVFHKDYGSGEVWAVNPNEVLKYKGKDKKTILHKGTIEIAFDSEMGEDDGNGGQKTMTFLSDGREQPVGSGYFWKGTFNEFNSSIELSKI